MPFEEFRKECQKLTGKKKVQLEEPPEEVDVDVGLALPCFQLSKEPQKYAKKLEKKINKKKKKYVKEVKAEGPYLNFYINWDKFGKDVIKEVVLRKGKYGKGKDKKEKIMVEYCHANTHKAFHIGHVRNITLGESLSRIMGFAGFDVIRANYQGDVGMHVAKCLWGLENLDMKPCGDRGEWLGKVYTEASKKYAGSKKVQEEVNEINQRLHKGDKKWVGLWKKSRQWSLDYFGNIYKDFGAKFDRLYFESGVQDRGKKMAKNLLEKGVAKKSQNAIVMDLEKYGLDVFLILKSDGTPLYSTKDLGLAKIEKEEYGPDKIIHVVGSEQKLYFEQLFKTFELGYKKLRKGQEHLVYGLVNLKSGKMASRMGKVVLYEDVLDDLVERGEKETKKRNAKLGKEEIEERGRKIALSALKYSMLNTSSNKVITFDPEEAISFEGNTGPYLQYTFARANSILEKSEKKVRSGILKKEKEKALVKKMALFPVIVQNAAKDRKPNIITNYLFELANLFNTYYHDTRVIGSKKEKKRLALTKAVSIVLKNGLELLGIDVLEEM